MFVAVPLCTRLQFRLCFGHPELFSTGIASLGAQAFQVRKHTVIHSVIRGETRGSLYGAGPRSSSSSLRSHGQLTLLRRLKHWLYTGIPYCTLTRPTYSPCVRFS